jgi:hypothetical protein
MPATLPVKCECVLRPPETHHRHQLRKGVCATWFVSNFSLLTVARIRNIFAPEPPALSGGCCGPATSPAGHTRTVSHGAREQLRQVPRATW